MAWVSFVGVVVVFLIGGWGVGGGNYFERLYISLLINVYGLRYNKYTSRRLIMCWNGRIFPFS